MNRAQSRAQWRSRIRQQRAASAGDLQSAFATRVNTSVLARPRIASSTHVRVNELEFRGFENSSARRIASYFERELTLLLQAHSLPAHWRGNLGRARTGPVRLHSLTNTRRIGEQLAQALFAFEADGDRPGLNR